VIITLGEVILGTVAALNAVVHGEAGWSVDAALLAVAGVGLTSAAGGCTSRSRGPSRSPATASAGFRFGYGHLVIFGSLAAMGAGLHVAALRRSRTRPKIGATGAVLSVAIPFASTSPCSTPLLGAHARLRPVPRRPDRGTAACWSCRSSLAAAA
jgi:low temperature requirement protein LtrA